VNERSAISACPCGRQDSRQRPVTFAACCGRYVDHFVACPAPDAEHLMRSRYTAFVLRSVDYLLATWHADHRPVELVLDPATKWLGLEVKTHRVLAVDRAEVLFVARSALNGRASRLQEYSRFVREGDRWYYTDGDIR
jgi:SEC-C motif-containing protein